MRTTPIRWPRTLALLGLTIALNACGEIVSTTDKDKGAAKPALPVIAAQIGDTWDEVIRHSTFKLGPLPMEAGTIINKPHTFIYRDPRHPMQLDNVGYMGVSVGYEGTHPIDSIAIGPYPDSTETDETWRRMQDIVQKMEKAGWIADDDRNKRNPYAHSAAELRSQYLNLPGGAQGAEKFWYDEYGNEAWVRLVKTIVDDPGLHPEPRFNIVLDIQVATHPKHAKTAK